MKYSVIHSNDPYLLARMATDLQMSGVPVDLEWCEDCNPFDDESYYLHSGDPGGICFYNHDACSLTEHQDRHELTESNYLDVLEAVLS